MVLHDIVSKTVERAGAAGVGILDFYPMSCFFFLFFFFFFFEHAFRLLLVVLRRREEVYLLCIADSFLDLVYNRS